MSPAGTGGPIAILAGSGRLPLSIAEALDEAGRSCRIVAFRGFASPALRRRADVRVDLLDVKRTLACLDAWRPAGVLLAGAVARPGPVAVLSAFAAFRNRAELDRILAQGDDRMLRSVLGLIEERGHPVVGIRDVAPKLLGRLGALTTAHPTSDDERAIAVGRRLLRDLSPYDVAQSAVVAAERVLAVEGPEGTDATLRRVARSRRSWTGRRTGSGGVLVKLSKEGQDLRVDLPTIGPRTVLEVHRAGLRGIAYEGRRTLIVDEADTVAAANRRGLFLVGLESSGDPVA